MSTVLNEKEIFDAVHKATAVLHDSEKFPVPILAVRATKAAEIYPYDASLVSVSNVLKKMASDNRMFISRAELNKLYDNFYAPNSKLTEIFAEELERKSLPGPKFMPRAANEGVPVEFDYKVVGDSLLVNALSGVFDGSNEDRIYSPEIAAKAERACELELKSLDLVPKAISTFAGRNDLILCQATYETPKGLTNVLIPVEVEKGNALFPTMFLSQAGVADLDRTNLENHIKTTAGRSLKVNGEKLLEVLSVAKNGLPEDKVSEVEMAVLALKAETQTPHTEGGIVYQKFYEFDAPVIEPEMEKSAEHETLEKRLTSPAGFAELTFGKHTVEAGRGMVKRHLKNFGFGDVQVSVADCNDNTVVYAVSVNRQAGLKVPVKVSNGMVLPPELALAGDTFDKFTAVGVSRLISANSDSKMLAVASPMYDMKTTELMSIIREAIAEGNLAKAEDAIDVLGETDPQAQKRAMNLLIDSHNPEVLKKVASEQKGCAMIVKSSASQHPLCGHLNMPLHKVYQDKHGDCQPLYRKAMEDIDKTDERLTYKIFNS